MRRSCPCSTRYPLPNDPHGPYGDAHLCDIVQRSSRAPISFPCASTTDFRQSARCCTRFSLNQVTGPVTNPDQTAIDPSFAVQFFDHQRNAGVKYSRTISPHLISETSFGYIRSTPFFPAINHTQPGISFGDGLFQSFNSAGRLDLRIVRQSLSVQARHELTCTARMPSNGAWRFA